MSVPNATPQVFDFRALPAPREARAQPKVRNIACSMLGPRRASRCQSLCQPQSCRFSFADFQQEGPRIGGVASSDGISCLPRPVGAVGRRRRSARAVGQSVPFAGRGVLADIDNFHIDIVMMIIMF